MMKKVYYSPIILLILTLFACKKDNSIDFHFEYFGMEQGRYIVYDVVEIEHDDALNQHDTTIYQLFST